MARVGVESCYGFGDCVLNVPLIRTISEHYGCKVGVAVRPDCADAFVNIPWIDNIIHVPGLHCGSRALREAGYDPVFQITQNIKFEEFREHDHTHSLLDTPAATGHQLGLPPFDPRPIFLPTNDEIANGQRYDDGLPNIAIEHVYKSGQSWADAQAIGTIVARYADTHRICWCSNQDSIDSRYRDDMLRWTRRQIICMLRYTEVFFSVGSGYFCACLGLPPELQPKKIICLWRDEYYRYEGRLAELGWHGRVDWVHSHAELTAALG